MGYLTIGTMTIPFAWIGLILAYLFIDVRYRKTDAQWVNAFEHLLWVYLIFWKLSYIIFYVDAFLTAPMSLVYFDGGWKGQLLALAAVIFEVYRKKMLAHFKPLVTVWLQFAGAFLTVVLLLNGQFFFAAFVGLSLFFVEKKLDTIAFSLVLAALIVQENWMSSFLWIMAILLSVLLVKRKNDYIAPVLITTLVALFAQSFIETSISTAKEVAPLELETVEVSTYAIREDENSIIVLNFFATWCPPCKAEMPHLQAFADKLPGDVSLIGVNLTARDDGEQALHDFMKRHKVTYPIALDVDDVYGDAYNVFSMPTTVVLKNGEEVERIIGPVSEETLKNLVHKFKNE